VLPVDSDLFGLLLDSHGRYHESPASVTSKRALGAKEVP